MYQPETEDMLPRCAPKPTASDVSEAIIRPSVPEVSIVFSQAETSLPATTSTSSITTFAAWKRQCVPHPPYLPIGEDSPKTEYTNLPVRSPVFPMRIATSLSPTINTASAPVVPPKIETNILRKSTCNVESPLVVCPPTYTVSSNYSPINYSRRSMDSTPRNDVLTICASTQTDIPLNKFSEQNVDNLATKNDLEQLYLMMSAMRTEQQRMMELIQHFLTIHENSQKQNVILKDAASQSDPCSTPAPPPVQSPPQNTEDKPREYNNIPPQLQKNVNILVDQPPKLPQLQRPVYDLLKPATEQSIVMNELAIKYLPNDKLNELFQGLHVAQFRPTTQAYEVPLKSIQNFTHNCTDMSNSSYKYLKKYKLLPEENDNLQIENKRMNAAAQEEQENILDLEAIRRQPKFL